MSGLSVGRHHRARQAQRQAVIRGSRITVYDVLGYLASGMTEDEILKDFLYLTRNDIRACLAYAAEHEQAKLVAAS